VADRLAADGALTPPEAPRGRTLRVDRAAAWAPRRGDGGECVRPVQVVPGGNYQPANNPSATLLPGRLKFVTRDALMLEERRTDQPHAEWSSASLSSGTAR